MPRITIEDKRQLTNNVSEVITKTFDLPEQIICKGKTLNYDSILGVYTNDDAGISVSPEDYLKQELKINFLSKSDEEEYLKSIYRYYGWKGDSVIDDELAK